MDADYEEFDLETLNDMLDSNYDDEDTIEFSVGKNHVNANQSQDHTAASSEVLSNIESKEELENELKLLEAKMQQLREKLKVKEDPQTGSGEVKEETPQTGSGVVKDASQTSSGNAPKLKSVDVDMFTMCKNLDKNNSTDGLHQNDTDRGILHTGDTDSSEDEDDRNPLTQKYNQYGQFVKKRLSHLTKDEFSNSENICSWKRKNLIPSNMPSSLSSEKSKRKLENNNENFETDPFSGIRIINPLVSSVEMQERMTGRKMVSMSSIQKYIIGGDIEGDWVTIGVIVSKDIKKSSKGNEFSIWKLCDLKVCNKLVTLFLFGKTHGQLWKTSVASVIGILNASFMPNRDMHQVKRNGSEICLTVDNPQKIMLMGTSKDFGTCKGKRRDGTACTMLINKAVCEFCNFHVQKEFRKMSSKRMEFQASFSGEKHNGLKTKMLQNVIYGGNMYCSDRPEKRKCNSQNMKDKLTLNNLKLHKKAKDMEKLQLDEISESQMALETTSSVPTSCEQPFEKMLSIPTVGALNLIKHRKTKSETLEGESETKIMLKTITPSELLKMHAKKLNSMIASRKSTTENSLKPTDSLALKQSADAFEATPKLGRGYHPGDKLDLNVDFRRKRLHAAQMAAIKQIYKSGPLKPEDPNAVKQDSTTKEFQEKIRKQLNGDCDSTELDCRRNPSKRQRSDVDMSSESFQKLLNQKSRYECLVEEENLKREEKYFNEMEKKESIETKMVSTMECPCKAVSCRKCNYTAFSALDICRKEGHPLKIHNATKRFFRCKNCKTRTVSLSKLPTRPCRNCREKNYERVAMWKEREGPKLDSERLSLRGDEIKYVNSSFQGNLNECL